MLKKTALIMALASLLAILSLPLIGSDDYNMCCDMEDAMEEAYYLQDYTGFNNILADWMASHCTY